MGLNIEIFTSVINKNLTQNNVFMTMGTDHSQYVKYLDGEGNEKSAAIVHVPSAGALPGITKNRSSFPIVATNRADVDLTYNINTYDAGVFYMTRVDSETVAYDKASSLLDGMNKAMLETVGNQTAYAWAPTSATTFGVTRIIRTSGPTGTTLASGSTGVRNSLALADFVKAKVILDNDNAYGERYMVVPSAMWAEILQLANITQFLQLGSTSGLQEGKISPQTMLGFEGKIYGFNVVTRNSVVTYTTTTGGTQSLQLIAIGDDGVQTTSNATDELGAIFFEKGCVSNAVGSPVLFYNADQALYSGSLFGAVIRHGAAKIRANVDGKGVGAIVQI